MLHTARLVHHERQGAADQRAILRLDVGDGFEKAPEHGERRAQLVGYVCDEVTAHRLHALEVRDVAADHQLLAVTIRNQLHRQDEVPAARLPQHQRLAKTLGVKVFGELGLPHEIGDLLARITLTVQSEVLFRSGIAPLDAVGRIQYDHAVGHCRAGLLKVMERCRQAGLALALPAQHPVQVGKYLVPDPPTLGHRLGLGVLKPAP